VTVDESSVVELVCDARTRVLRLLWELGDRERAEIVARCMIATGAVIACRDRDGRGAVAYKPANVPEMRLAERVASLFVADYLNAPFDYKDVRVCPDCGSIAWSTELEHSSSCRSAAAASSSATSSRRDSHIAKRERSDEDQPFEEDEDPTMRCA